jgi:hypothetical protein
MHNYRRENGEQRLDEPSKESSQSLRRLLELVKNSAAVKLTSYPATLWLISSDKNVKNILAGAELILIETASGR